MVDATLVLVQKEDSPLRPRLAQALARVCRRRVVKRAGLPLPRVAYGPQGLVVWDVSGFGQDELEELIRDFSSDRVGLLLAGEHAGGAFDRAFGQAAPLGLVAAGQPAEALAATLELAWANHRRVCSLRSELDKLRGELSDRLVVEKAKRLLMSLQGCSEGDAMRRLQRYSRNTNQKLAKVAQQLIAGYEVLGEAETGAAGEGR